MSHKRIDNKAKFLLATNDFSALRALGYTASDLRAAGYTASDLRALGYTTSDLRALGYTASDLRALGYTASDLRAAGYTASEINRWKKIPTLKKPYTQMLADLKAKKRIHQQSTFGPEHCIEEKNVCGTAMCTAGHLVQMAYAAGWKDVYEYVNERGWEMAATIIHKKAHPSEPTQNFGNIPQDWALAYIEEMAKKEKK